MPKLVNSRYYTIEGCKRVNGARETRRESPSCPPVRKENFHTNKVIEGNGRGGDLLA
jgi:hypothetical protein